MILSVMLRTTDKSLFIVGDWAEGVDDEVSARFGALAVELLRERLQAMVREGRRAEALDGLRTVFGEARADVIAAAFMPDEPTEPRMTGQKGEHRTRDAPGGRPQQGKLL